MKCDELKAETIVPQGSAITLQMYGKAEVDEAIAELKAQNELFKKRSSCTFSDDCLRVRQLRSRIHELENMPHTDNSAVIELLKKENEDLKNELFAVKTDAAMATRWRKVDEELPEDGSDVLATDGYGIWLCYKTTMPDGLPWFQPDGLPHIEGVTHWMPLPKAPEADK